MKSAIARSALKSSFVAAAVVAACALSGVALAAEEVVSWKLDVQPILQARCVECHKPGGQGWEISGLDLTSYDGLMKGTKHGPIVVAGEPLTSNLLVLVEGRADPKMRMPHGQRPLLKQQTDIIRLWIKQGAKNN